MLALQARLSSNKAQNVSPSKCLAFFFLIIIILFVCQIFNFLLAMFCVHSCLQKVVLAVILLLGFFFSLPFKPSLNSFVSGVMMTGHWLNVSALTGSVFSLFNSRGNSSRSSNTLFRNLIHGSTFFDCCVAEQRRCQCYWLCPLQLGAPFLECIARQK